MRSRRAVRASSPQEISMTPSDAAVASEPRHRPPPHGLRARTQGPRWDAREGPRGARSGLAGKSAHEPQSSTVAPHSSAPIAREEPRQRRGWRAMNALMRPRRRNHGCRSRRLSRARTHHLLPPCVRDDQDASTLLRSAPAPPTDRAAVRRGAGARTVASPSGADGGGSGSNTKILVDKDRPPCAAQVVPAATPPGGVSSTSRRRGLFELISASPLPARIWGDIGYDSVI